MTTPAPRPRRTLPEIAPVSWEHPADRAALQTLRSVPGFEEVTRKILAFLGGERGIRLLFQANAVRVGPTQFPKLWSLHVEACTTFHRRPSSTPAPMAWMPHLSSCTRRHLSCWTTTSSGCS